MRKRISLLVAALMLALTMSFGSVAAFADAPPWQGNDQQFHNKCTGGEKHKNCKNA